MTFSLKPWERDYLRELAKKQLEYAKLPIMEERKKQWYNTNNGIKDRTPIVIETWTFDQDMMPNSIYKSESKDARHLEYCLLKNIREHELINDDKVIPDFFTVGYNVKIDEFGIEIGQEHKNESGGYRFIHPITDLKRDFEKLKLPELSHDMVSSLAYRDFISDIIGDILPVEFESRSPHVCLTQKVIKLMGMENFFIAMYEEPDDIHRLMNYLVESQLKIMRYFEENKLLTVNNGNHQTGPTSYAFTNKLPSPDFASDNVRLKDICLWVESQETVGVSPDMFNEFCLPYYKQAAEPLGLVYYGCCEPVHPIWNDIYKAIPQIFKVSISPWCNQKYMGEALTGTDVVFSRKPSPQYLGVETVLNEEAWAAHIRETVTATKNCQCEIIMRDIYKVGDLAKVKRAIEIARNEIDIV